MQVVRPGVDVKWLSAWRRQTKLNDTYRAERREGTLKRLQYYVANGVSPDPTGNKHERIKVTPPWAAWESFLDGDLLAYAAELQSDFEQKGAVRNEYDSPLAAQAFAAKYTSQFIRLRAHALFPSRFPGRNLQMLSLKDVGFTTLGLITGAREEALRLARLQIRAYHRQYYFDTESYPIFVLMLRLLADYLAEEPLEIRGEARDEPLCASLFNEWRGKDRDGIAEICLAVGDYHTHRCGLPKRDFYHEFANGTWMRTPIELLLLFKLRMMIGLDYPTLDHPLLNTVLGRLPEEIGFQPDNLVSQVRARLVLDGYDETAISALY